MPTDPDALELLRRGTLEIEGRLVDASNATLFCAIEADGVAAQCVYKPVRGERPLWDFPDGTLAGREVGAYLVSEASGLGLIPPTVLRSGPLGPGMVQLWVDTDDERALVDVVAPAELPAGWKAILRARDADGEPAVLAHSDSAAIAKLSALDVVINNADRKGGHVLLGADGGVYGVDHGISLHSEHKLRTVLWGWAEEPFGDEVVEALVRLRSALSGSLAEDLGEHITRAELKALRSRVSRLINTPVYPSPDESHYPIPWPAF
ncbi:phosphatidylinositol kinase [Actinokineospora bangkokensis]|uniref:Phosphatidylinositol kinase n=1 Tax=Actinokineospora bangkokensis TaxID=1193682 RepID=A0A1Q9LPG4_9PSEU|nr:phosphatidylinositol kinase [Actinokineospora bangkokensis]